MEQWGKQDYFLVFDESSQRTKPPCRIIIQLIREISRNAADLQSITVSSDGAAGEMHPPSGRQISLPVRAKGTFSALEPNHIVATGHYIIWGELRSFVDNSSQYF